MERRRSIRKKVHIEAEIVSEDISHSGIIENVSEHGINIETASKSLFNTTTLFTPGTELEVRFQDSSGERIRLHCKVIWSYKTAPHGLTNRAGMEIIFPPPDYIDFYKKIE